MKHTADFGKKKHLKGKDLKLHSADNFKNSVRNNIHQTAADGIETGSKDMSNEFKLGFNQAMDMAMSTIDSNVQDHELAFIIKNKLHDLKYSITPQK